jgi:hypothetical protein
MFITMPKIFRKFLPISDIGQARNKSMLPSFRKILLLMHNLVSACLIHWEEGRKAMVSRGN